MPKSEKPTKREHRLTVRLAAAELFITGKTITEAKLPYELAEDVRDLARKTFGMDITESPQRWARMQPFRDKIFWFVERLKLPTRPANSLARGQIYYVGELVQKTEDDLLKIEFLGKRNLDNIKYALDKAGLHLGMEASDWRFFHGGDDAGTEDEPVNMHLFRKVRDLRFPDLKNNPCPFLETSGILYTGELVQKTPDELLGIERFKKEHLRATEDALDKIDLHLGMEIDNWRPR